MLDALVEASQGTVRKIIRELEREGISVNDRRQARTVFSVQAYAALYGAREVSADHLEIAQHSLWAEPKQHSVVAEVIARLAEPLGMQVHRFQLTTEAIVKGTDPREHAEARKAAAKLAKIDELLGLLKRTDRVNKAHEQVKEHLRQMRRACSTLREWDE